MSQYFEENKFLKSENKPIKIYFQNKEYNIHTDNGIFSKEKLDYGTRLLLECITQKQLTGTILDLGCGYGIVGLIIATNFPKTFVDMVDITERSIKLSQQNTKKLTNVNVFKSDIYKQITKKYNYIVTNPPIRAGKEVIRSFLLNAQKYLYKDGELWFVMRKNHGVKTIIKELESEYKVNIEKKSKGFYIVKCQNK